MIHIKAESGEKSQWVDDFLYLMSTGLSVLVCLVSDSELNSFTIDALLGIIPAFVSKRSGSRFKEFLVGLVVLHR